MLVKQFLFWRMDGLKYRYFIRFRLADRHVCIRYPIMHCYKKMFGFLHPHPIKMVFLGVYDHILLHFEYISAEKLGLFETVCVRTDL